MNDNPAANTVVIDIQPDDLNYINDVLCKLCVGEDNADLKAVSILTIMLANRAAAMKLPFEMMVSNLGHHYFDYHNKIADGTLTATRAESAEDIPDWQN